MTDAVSNTLLQYGAMGAVLLVFLGMFSWGFRIIVVRFLRAFDAMVQVLTDLSRDHAVHATTTGEYHHAVMDKLEAMKRDSRERRPTKP